MIGVSDIMIELAVFITVEVALAVWLGIKFYAKKAVEHGFKEKIEDHKHDLGLITEATKFNYGRLNQDFGLWTVKRHEAYAKLHAAIANAVSRTMGLRGFMRIPDYQQYSEEEIEQLLKDRNFTQADIDSVLLWWDSDRGCALKRLNNLDKLHREYLAEMAYGEAQNALIESQLYTSAEINTKLEELIGKVYKLLVSYRAEYSDEAKRQEEASLREFIPEDWKQITTKMRVELSGGYVQE